MNNELISKIAELLQITTQKASELYPVLVNETVLNSVINNSVLAIIAVDALAFLFWDNVEDLTREKTRNFITALLITLTLVSGVFYIFKPFLTPNITFLNGLFNK
ncbi:MULTISPECIES: hypothetical protein [unclassified Granulicatella]|uniref:hypothetical protein n=1 Tax=unclassified Granulicatella TaxID=2630493 RepID=UPI00066A83FA|nr:MULTISPECIES: hypothetical protein [unclassified Granulicatella]DAS17431.1 MAG TPA: hypothetical protein [Caudoviricetes sp.]